MSIGSKIKSLRKEKGLTQKELGDLCGMADSAIRRYESDRGNPTEKTLKKIASALGVNFFELLTPEQIERKRNENQFIGLIDQILYSDDISLELHKRLDAAFFQLNHDGQKEAVKFTELLQKDTDYLKK